MEFTLFGVIYETGTAKVCVCVCVCDQRQVALGLATVKVPCHLKAVRNLSSPLTDRLM